LQKRGYITARWKGSIVRRAKNTLGLLTVRDFSETVEYEVRNVMEIKQSILMIGAVFSHLALRKKKWFRSAFFSLACVCVGTILSCLKKAGWRTAFLFHGKEFVMALSFKTLSKRY
jgi:hypothetical protein